MNKSTRRSVGILAGLILWGFYLIQGEFAFYGIYSLISYRIHEISEMIPIICLLVTFVWMVVIIKEIIQKKANKIDKWFTVILLVLMLAQIEYIRQDQEVSTRMVVTVENVNPENNTITVVNAEREDGVKVELFAPDLFINMVEIGDQKYFASYVHEKGELDQGKLSMLTLMQSN